MAVEALPTLIGRGWGGGVNTAKKCTFHYYFFFLKSEKYEYTAIYEVRIVRVYVVYSKGRRKLSSFQIKLNSKVSKEKRKTSFCFKPRKIYLRMNNAQQRQEKLFFRSCCVFISSTFLQHYILHRFPSCFHLIFSILRLSCFFLQRSSM
jgi:hypothetical protein